jgi:hypothetical protein
MNGVASPKSPNQVATPKTDPITPFTATSNTQRPNDRAPQAKPKVAGK